MNNEPENCEQLSLFKEYIQQGEHPQNNLSFQAKIIYKSKTKEGSFSAGVDIRTGFYPDGIIYIDPEKESNISEKDCHLYFEAQYGELVFNEKNSSLEIRGFSKKDGKYKVQIFSM